MLLGFSYCTIEYFSRIKIHILFMIWIAFKDLHHKKLMSCEMYEANIVNLQYKSVI